MEDTYRFPKLIDEQNYSVPIEIIPSLVTSLRQKGTQNYPEVLKKLSIFALQKSESLNLLQENRLMEAISYLISQIDDREVISTDIGLSTSAQQALSQIAEKRPGGAQLLIESKFIQLAAHTLSLDQQSNPNLFSTPQNLHSQQSTNHIQHQIAPSTSPLQITIQTNSPHILPAIQIQQPIMLSPNSQYNTSIPASNSQSNLQQGISQSNIQQSNSQSNLQLLQISSSPKNQHSPQLLSPNQQQPQQQPQQQSLYNLYQQSNQSSSDLPTQIPSHVIINILELLSKLVQCRTSLEPLSQIIPVLEQIKNQDKKLPGESQNFQINEEQKIKAMMILAGLVARGVKSYTDKLKNKDSNNQHWEQERAILLQEKQEDQIKYDQLKHELDEEKEITEREKKKADKSLQIVQELEDSKNRAISETIDYKKIVDKLQEQISGLHSQKDKIEKEKNDFKAQLIQEKNKNKAISEEIKLIARKNSSDEEDMVNELDREDTYSTVNGERYNKHSHAFSKISQHNQIMSPISQLSVSSNSVLSPIPISLQSPQSKTPRQSKSKGSSEKKNNNSNNNEQSIVQEFAEILRTQNDLISKQNQKIRDRERLIEQENQKQKQLDKEKEKEKQKSKDKSKSRDIEIPSPDFFAPQNQIVIPPPISPVDTQVLDNICQVIHDMAKEYAQIEDDKEYSEGKGEMDDHNTQSTSSNSKNSLHSQQIGFNSLHSFTPSSPSPEDQKRREKEKEKEKENVGNKRQEMTLTQEAMKTGLFNSLQTILLNLPIDEIQPIQASTLYWLIHSADYISKCKMIEIGVTKVLVKLSRHNNAAIGEYATVSMSKLVTAAKKYDKESTEFKIKETEQSSPLLPQMESEGLLEALIEGGIAKPAPKQKKLQRNSKTKHTAAVTICDIYEDSVIPKKYRDGVIEQFNRDMERDNDKFAKEGAESLADLALKQRRQTVLRQSIKILQNLILSERKYVKKKQQQHQAQTSVNSSFKSFTSQGASVGDKDTNNNKDNRLNWDQNTESSISSVESYPIRDNIANTAPIDKIIEMSNETSKNEKKKFQAKAARHLLALLIDIEAVEQIEEIKLETSGKKIDKVTKQFRKQTFAQINEMFKKETNKRDKKWEQKLEEDAAQRNNRKKSKKKGDQQSVVTEQPNFQSMPCAYIFESCCDIIKKLCAGNQMAVNEIMRTELPQRLISLLTNTPPLHPLTFTHLASLTKLVKNADDEIQHKMFEMGIIQALVKLLSFGYDDRKMAEEIVEAISSVVIVGLSKGSAAEPHPYRDILEKNEIRDEVDTIMNQQEDNKTKQKEKKQSQEDELKRVIDVLYKYGVQKAINERVRSITSMIIGWLYRSVPIPVRFVPPVDVNFTLNTSQYSGSDRESESPMRKKDKDKGKQKQDDKVLLQQQKDGMNVVVNLQKAALNGHDVDQINAIDSLSAIAECQYNHIYIASKQFLLTISQFILTADYDQKSSEAAVLQNALWLFLRLMQKGNQITQRSISDIAPHDRIKELANLHQQQNAFIDVSKDLISNAVKLHSWLADMAHMQRLAELKGKIVDKSAEERRKFIESQEEDDGDDESGDDKSKNGEKKQKMTIIQELTNIFISVSGREEMEGARCSVCEIIGWLMKDNSASTDDILDGEEDEDNKEKEGEGKNEEDKKMSIQGSTNKSSAKKQRRFCYHLQQLLNNVPLGLVHPIYLFATINIINALSPDELYNYNKENNLLRTLARLLKSKDEIILDRASYSIERILYAGVEAEEDIVDDEDEDDESDSDSQDDNEKKKDQEETEEQKQKRFQKEMKKMQDFIKKRDPEKVREDKLRQFRLQISQALEADGSVGQLVSLFKRGKTLQRTDTIGQVALSLAWIYRGAQFPKRIFPSMQTTEDSQDIKSASNVNIALNQGWNIPSQNISPNMLTDIDWGNDVIMHLKQRVKAGVGIEMTETEKKDENLVKDASPYFTVNSIAALSWLAECNDNHDLILNNNFEAAIVSIILNEKNSTSNIIIYTLQLVNSIVQSGSPTTKSSMKQFEEKKFLDRISHFVNEGKEVVMMNESERKKNNNSQKELIGKIALDVQVALLVMKNKKREQISQKLRERGSQKEQKVDDSKRWRNMMGMSRSRRVGIENIEVNNSLLYSGFMKEEFEQGEEYGSATQQITVGYEDQEDEEEEEDEFSIESQEEKMDEDEVD